MLLSNNSAGSENQMIKCKTFADGTVFDESPPELSDITLPLSTNVIHIIFSPHTINTHTHSVLSG